MSMHSVHFYPIIMISYLFMTLLVTFGSTEPVPILRHRKLFTPSGRIVGGSDISIREVPYQVSLQVNNHGFCGGSIITEYWVITAGHCILYSASIMTIRAGSDIEGSEGSVHKVAKVIKHEGYTTNKYGIPINDLALIKVATPFKLDGTRQPIVLFEDNEEAIDGSYSMITGWGAIKSDSRSGSRTLQTISIPIISKSACYKAYSYFGGIPSGQICAAHPSGRKDACQGDSGGPLAIDGRLAGIVSWGNGCAKPGYPGVYTEIASFREWIRQKTNL